MLMLLKTCLRGILSFIDLIWVLMSYLLWRSSVNCRQTTWELQFYKAAGCLHNHIGTGLALLALLDSISCSTLGSLSVLGLCLVSETMTIPT